MVYTLVVEFEVSAFFNHNRSVDENPLTVERKTQMLSDICSRHGARIRAFHIYNGMFDNPNDLYNILKSMPLLEKFSLQKMNLNFTDGSDRLVQPVVMKHLQELQVSMTGFNFRYLIGSQPRTMSLINLQRNSMKFFNELVESLEKLETLTLSGNVALNVFLQTEKKFKFKLKKLEIVMSPNDSYIERANEDHICSFLCSQASSLRELKLLEVSTKVLETALTSIPLLESLSLFSFKPDVATSFPVDGQFYDSLQPLTKLRELFVSDVWSDEAVAKGILQKCPALEKLEVTRYSANLKIISFIAASNPNIEHLQLYRLTVDDSPEVEFKFLKYFRLTMLDGDVGNVTLLLRNNPTIEKFVIERSGSIPDPLMTDLVRTLVRMPNLKYLEFSSIPETLRRIYDGFANYKGNRSICVVLGFLIFGRGSFLADAGPAKRRFQFPEDAGQWDTKCSFITEVLRNPRRNAMTGRTIIKRRNDQRDM